MSIQEYDDAELRNTLRQKVLSHGGDAVCVQDPEPNRDLIAERGQLFTQPIRKRRGEPHDCHGNASRIWASDIEKNLLVTGYGLSHGSWLSHSWVLRGGIILETTVRFEQYFGVVLPSTRAYGFWIANADKYVLPRPTWDEWSDDLLRLSVEYLKANIHHFSQAQLHDLIEGRLSLFGGTGETGRELLAISRKMREVVLDEKGLSVLREFACKSEQDFVEEYIAHRKRDGRNCSTKRKAPRAVTDSVHAGKNRKMTAQCA